MDICQLRFKNKRGKKTKLCARGNGHIYRPKSPLPIGKTERVTHFTCRIKES